MKIPNISNNIIKTPAEYRKWMQQMMPMLFKEPSGLEHIKKPASSTINGLYKAYNSPEHNLFLAHALSHDIQSALKSTISDFKILYKKLSELSDYEYKILKKSCADKVLGKRMPLSLNFLCADNNVIRVSYDDFDELLKIIIFDSKGKAQRGYLVEDGRRIIKNLNINRHNSLPHVMLYGDKKFIDSISEQFTKDLKSLASSMKKTKEFI